jgi:hypothetical protein
MKFALGYGSVTCHAAPISGGRRASPPLPIQQLLPIAQIKKLQFDHRDADDSMPAWSIVEMHDSRDVSSLSTIAI